MRPEARIIMTFPRITSRFLAALVYLAVCSLASLPAAGGTGSADSAAGVLDTQAPVVEILAPSEEIMLRGGDIYDFRWTIDETNPGLGTGDQQAFVLFEDQIYQVYLFSFGLPEYTWHWDVPETTVFHSYLSVVSRDAFGNLEQVTSERMFLLPSTTPVTDELPALTALRPAAPNPFNPQTQLSFDLAAEAEIDLAVYDLQGRRVRTLASGPRPAGTTSVTWTGADAGGRRVAAGLYLVRLKYVGAEISGNLVQKVVMLP